MVIQIQKQSLGMIANMIETLFHKQILHMVANMSK